MSDDKEKETSDGNEFRDLLAKSDFKTPRQGDMVRGTVLSASKAEVRLDIDGIMTGVVRGPELYEEDDDYAGLKPGDEVEATVIEAENENGELELSFRYAGQERAWAGLREALESKSAIRVRVADANRGGLLVKYKQIPGFLPVSQLAPENYPRVSGGDKGKILDKLKSFVGQDIDVKLITLNEKEDKIIFSEKEAWSEKQRDVIQKYKVGTVVEGTITAITDFGVFISFDENLEGLIHISELAWQRIDNPSDLYRAGDKIRAEVISLENSKIFLSAKRLMKDPWENVGEKYRVGQIVEGVVLKVNPFGLFVKLDEDIHGLAHVSQLWLAPKQRVGEKFRTEQKALFEIVSIEPKDHRLGLAYRDVVGREAEKGGKEKADGEGPKTDAGEKDGKTEKKKTRKEKAGSPKDGESDRKTEKKSRKKAGEEKEEKGGKKDKERKKKKE